MRSRDLITVGTLSVVLGGLSACGAMGGLSADTSCHDYLQATATERHDAAVRISSEVEGVQSPGNPMWGLSLDAACGSNPSMTIGEIFGAKT